MEIKNIDFDFVCSRLDSGKTIISMAKHLGIDRTFLGKKLKEYGWKRNKPVFDCDKICNMIRNGKTEISIAKELGTNRENIYHILKHKNVDINRLKFNYNFFETINNEEKAYWLGFIMADGCVSDTQRIKMCIKLHKKDTSHLIKFHKAIESRNKLCLSGEYIASSHYSKKLCQDLIELGCTPRKSLTLKFPLIPKNFIHHFIRGYFDGDGCFYMNPKTRNATITIVGTKDFLMSTQKHLCTKVKLYSQSKCYKLGISGNIQVRRIIEYMYKDATVWLDRKMVKITESGINK